MIRVNLLPVKELEAEVTRQRDLMVGGVTLGVTLVVLLGLYLYQTYRLSSLGAEVARLRNEIQAFNIKVKEVGDLQNKIKEFKSKHTIIEDLSRKKVGPLRVMESLSAALPPSLWLTDFKETSGKLTLNGLAADNQTVAEFLKALAASAFFNDVELVEITQAEPKIGPYMKFSMRMAVSYQPPKTAGAVPIDGGAAVKEEKKS
jgi:type IV pilus assembly protein PilN